MTFPKCFESQQQFDAWKDADYKIYQSTRCTPTPVCTDCTPTYAAQMRLEGRCEHPEIKFVRFKDSFKGDVEKRAGAMIAWDEVKWEKEDVTDAKKPRRHARCRV